MTAYTIRNISKELWRAVKVLAAQRGISIRDLILNLLKKEVSNDK